MLIVNAVDGFVLLPNKLYNLSRNYIKQVNIGFDFGISVMSSPNVTLGTCGLLYGITCPLVSIYM